MKRFLKNRTIACQLLSVALAVSLALPLPSWAASVALATAPLATSTTSTVKPNVMFILDDSGSMGWDYLPDWANDNHPVTGTGYNSMAELFKNNGFNGVAYNPAVTYKPPVHYNADGTLNTTTYPSQTGATAATGADTTAKPNWKAVKNNAYSGTGTSNLTSASYYAFVPGEYCSSTSMTSCVAATAPSASYPYAAGVRWCNSAALTTCQSINNATYQYPRYPGGPLTPATRPTALITFSGTTANTNPGSEISANLAGPASVKLGATVVKSSIITIGKNKSASQAASAVQSAIGTGGTIKAYVGGNSITPTCQAASTSSVCLVDNSTYTNGSSVTVGTISLLGTLTYTTTASAGGDAVGTTVPGSNTLTNIVSGTDSYPYPGTTTKASTRSDCTTDTTDPKTCTYVEEMTNYANWWTYYHTRMQAMKTSVSRAFSTLDNRYRVGFSTISDHTATDSATFLNNNTFELAHKNSWYTKLFGTGVPSHTPLRGALSKAGRYYAKKVEGQTVDPVQYSCQQNFTILSTDGYWNADEESPVRSISDGGCTTNTAASTNYGAYGLDKQTCVGNLDGGTTARPMKEGTTAVSNTLADIAKYYYDTDLRTSALGNCTGGNSPDFPVATYPSGNPDVCTNNVFVSSTDNNLKQHMTTFTMGLGIDGTLNYTSDYLTATSGDYYNLKNGLGTPTVNWPNPIANSAGERIDDLWHAAVNGQGIYFSAKNPDAIITGFNTALSSITQKLGAAAAAATSTLNPVAGNNFAYVASYTTNVWKGNLESRPINIATGVVSETASWCIENIAAQTCAAPGTVVPDTSGSSTIYNCVVTGGAGACTAPGVVVGADCKTEIQNACTGTMPAKVAAATDTRTIYTAPAGGLTPLAGQNLVPFDAAYETANPANFATAHVNTINQWASISSQHTGAKLLKYLRGQYGYEIRSSNASSDQLYRAREAVLGDALESQPAYISAPVFSYPYPGYSAYKTAQAARAGTVYMGTNDGMMHAFAASDGAERWAYVPSMVIPNMWKLASTSYSNNHVNFVNGSPVTTDICTANCSNTSYADTVTTADDPVWKTILVGGLNGGGRGYYALDITVPTTPVLLWEFTTTNDSDLGYSFGVPVVTRKTDGTWVVLVTSGYNNTSPGDGQGYLYVLNAGTGAIISKISTGVGSTSTIAGVCATAPCPSGLAKIAGWNNEPAGNTVGYVYGGDLFGNLWRFDINNPVVVGSNPLKFATLFSDAGGTLPQPITTTPVLGKILDKRVVFIGTGKYLETSDLTTTQVQTQYAIKDDNATSTLVNPRTTLVQQTLTNNTDGTATRLATANTVNFSTGRGWYVDFPDSKERVNIDSKLVQGTLLVPTIVPSSTVCSPGGYGWLNYFDYLTGGPVDTATLKASAKYDSTIVGINVIYIGGTPKVGVVTSTNPTPELNTAVAFKAAAAGFTGQRMIWRELIP